MLSNESDDAVALSHDASSAADLIVTQLAQASRSKLCECFYCVELSTLINRICDAYADGAYGAAQADADDLLTAIVAIRIDMDQHLLCGVADDCCLDEYERECIATTFVERLFLCAHAKYRRMVYIAQVRAKRDVSLWGVLDLIRQGDGLLPAVPSQSNVASIADYTLLKRISGGAFGTVYLAEKNTTRDVYAIKIMRKNHLQHKNMVSQTMAERNIMALADNPFVVKLFYAFESADLLYFVMEWVCGGDCASLLDLLGEMPLAQTQRYVAEATLALRYLHKIGVVHRDLKPENMLISNTGHIILTDFGLSDTSESTADDSDNHANKNPLRTLSSDAVENMRTRRVKGTLQYLAPEAALGLRCGPGVDWWALGVVTFEFLTSCTPFNNENVSIVRQNILSCRVEWPLLDALPLAPHERRKTKQFIEQLLRVNVRNRLGSHGGAEQVMRHEFFEWVDDWEQLIHSDDVPFLPQLNDKHDTSYFFGAGERTSSGGSLLQRIQSEKDTPARPSFVEDSQITRIEDDMFKNFAFASARKLALKNSQKK